MEVAFLLNNKYRVHEVAKDFGKNSKEITDILTEYATTPKNHMQPLDDRELSLIFEYLTQHNQVDSLESIFAEVYREPKPAPKAEPAKPAQGGQKLNSCKTTVKQKGKAFHETEIVQSICNKPFDAI